MWCSSAFTPAYDCETQVSKGTDPVEQHPAETCRLIQAQQYKPVSSTVPQLPLSVSTFSWPLSRWLSSMQSDRSWAKGKPRTNASWLTPFILSSILAASLLSLKNRKNETKNRFLKWAEEKLLHLLWPFLFIYKGVFFNFILYFRQ